MTDKKIGKKPWENGRRKNAKIGVAAVTGRVGKLVVRELLSDRWSGLGVELFRRHHRRAKERRNSTFSSPASQGTFEASRCRH
ncbi:MAG: hypothetical protein IPO55_00235 [Alphaproteobacteria bacterium]|nr:hypothetical protein [Alphaproteobacteria bacterium]